MYLISKIEVQKAIRDTEIHKNKNVVHSVVLHCNTDVAETI